MRVRKCLVSEKYLRCSHVKWKQINNIQMYLFRAAQSPPFIDYLKISKVDWEFRIQRLNFLLIILRFNSKMGDIFVLTSPIKLWSHKPDKNVWKCVGRINIEMEMERTHFWKHNVSIGQNTKQKVANYTCLIIPVWANIHWILGCRVCSFKTSCVTNKTLNTFQYWKNG